MATYSYDDLRKRKQVQRRSLPVQRCTRCNARYVNIEGSFCPRCDLKRYEEREKRRQKHGLLRAH